MNDNILQFPKPKSKDNQFETVEIIDTAWINVLEELRKSGCDFAADPEKYFPAMVLIYESITSLYELSKGKEHPLQEFANEAMALAEEFLDENLGEVVEDSNFDEEIVFLDSEEMTVSEMFDLLEKENSTTKETVDK